MNFGTQALTLQIQRADTITSVVSNATPSVFGQTVKFTVTVAPNLACTPTGTVTLLDGANPIASNLPLSGGMATFSTSALSVGNHSITASYSGDHNFNATGSDAGSTANTLTQTVNKADTATSVTSSTNPSTYGQPVLVVFTATVSPVQPGAGTPTGMVTFEDGGVALTGFSTVGLTGGMATFSTTSTQLVAGTHSITAVYNGDIDFNFTGFDPGSTATALMQVVNKADTTTSVSPSMNSSIYGQAVTFTATVTPQYSGTPGGSVTFKDGGLVLAGSSTVNLSGGTASFTTTADQLMAGNHPITAVYSGDFNFIATGGDNGSTATTLTQIVQKADTTTSVAVSQPSTTLGDVVTVTATVSDGSGSSTGTPSGLVTLFDNGTPIGTGTLNGVSGMDQATFTTSLLSVAASPHSITAAYDGDANFNSTGADAGSTLTGAAD